MNSVSSIIPKSSRKLTHENRTVLGCNHRVITKSTVYICAENVIVYLNLKLSGSLAIALRRVSPVEDHIDACLVDFEGVHLARGKG